MRIILTLVSIFFILSVINYRKKHKKRHLPKYIKKRLSSTLGITTSNCPYCGKALKKFPSRKTKCENCHKFIYKRTRALDGATILVKENQLKAVDKEWEKKSFMLSYDFPQFEKYEEELKKIRKTNSVPFNDVIWHKYDKDYWDAWKKQDFKKITSVHFDRATFLMSEHHYGGALDEYLVFMFRRCCELYDLMQDTVLSKREKIKYMMIQITFDGNPGRCIEHLHLNEQKLKEMVLTMPLEIGFPFPYKIEELMPYYLHAYKKHERAKQKFEKEYKIHYLIGGDIATE